MTGNSAIAATAVQIVTQALFFTTARRTNGFAGIHEWVTGTRTVVASAVGVHALVQPARAPVEVPAHSRSVGPYRILDAAAGPLPNPGAALAYDDRLRRTVWLRFPEADADPVPHVRRVLRRPTRPRWLAGQRVHGLAWDAYEQVPGQPFDAVVTRPQSWATVRGWLCDLAEEVKAGLDDGSLPALEFDRVWIGNDGRAWLLDWPAPNDRGGGADSPPPEQAVDLPLAERFLYRFAVSALEGRVVADTQLPVGPPRLVLPRPATDCLEKLGERRFTTPEEMSIALIAAARGPAAISRTKRAVHLSLCAVPTIFMVVIGVLSVRFGFESSHPHIRSVSAGEAADRAGVEAGDVVVAVDSQPITFTEQLRDAARAHPDRPITLSILRQGRPLMIRARPARRANEGVLGIAIEDEPPERSLSVMWRFLSLQTLVGLILAGSLGLLSALTVRGGIALRLMNIAVITRNGTLASGARTRLRGVLSWLPALAASVAAFTGHSPLLTLTPQAAQILVITPMGLLIFLPHDPSVLFLRLAIITVALAVFALGVIAAVITPERGLQDRLAGTWLVPL
jgi:hypothetical protein